MIEKGTWQNWATTLKRNTYALYLASKEPGVPVLAKIMIVLVVAYALSPIDLIPDFIPILGYLDDLVLLPIGIWLAIRLIPPLVWARCQAVAAERTMDLSHNYRAAGVIIVIWVLILTGIVAVMVNQFTD